MSCVHDQERSFKVAESTSHVLLMTKKELLNLQRCYKVAESIFHLLISKKVVSKLRCLYMM